MLELKAELVNAAERVQIGGQEGSVRHAVPFGLRGVRDVIAPTESTDFEHISARIR
jgi:hypothetical protein